MPENSRRKSKSESSQAKNTFSKNNKLLNANGINFNDERKQIKTYVWSVA